jgi:release factor glutamine methyltransferase
VKVKDIAPLFLNELSSIYPDTEVLSFVTYSAKYILGFSRTDMVLRKEEELDKEKVYLFSGIVQKLKAEYPIQYIIGETEFFGLPFYVEPGVLIPRPETEELVDWIIRNNNNEKPSILDIGTGSGCIAVSLKKNIPGCRVTAMDISEKALEVAGKNAERNGTIIDFLKLDVLNFVDNEYLKKFDIIVSNPPYIRESEKLQMKQNVLRYEPAEALFVPDSEPLRFYEAIAGLSADHLYEGAYLYFEINEHLSALVSEMLVKKGFSDVVIRKDIHEKFRMLRCTLT